MQAIQITTTTGHRADAGRIAAALIERHQAACVQVVGPITSYYRWQGKSEKAEEWQCLIKTTPEAYEAVERTIRELHPYDEPEIVACPIVAGSDSYLDWLSRSVETDKRS